MNSREGNSCERMAAPPPKLYLQIQYRQLRRPNVFPFYFFFAIYFENAVVSLFTSVVGDQLFSAYNQQIQFLIL